MKKLDFTLDTFKKNWSRGNYDNKFMLNFWKWLTLLAFIAGFTFAAGIYSQQVNDRVQEHIEDVNAYMFSKYGYDVQLVGYLNNEVYESEVRENGKRNNTD